MKPVKLSTLTDRGWDPTAEEPLGCYGSSPLLRPLPSFMEAPATFRDDLAALSNAEIT